MFWLDDKKQSSWSRHHKLKIYHIFKKKLLQRTLALKDKCYFNFLYMEMLCFLVSFFDLRVTSTRWVLNLWPYPQPCSYDKVPFELDQCAFSCTIRLWLTHSVIFELFFWPLASYVYSMKDQVMYDLHNCYWISVL